MENPDIRAKILEDAYNKGMKGLQILHFPLEYAKLLGIPEELAFFNLRYLIKNRLLEGHVEPAGGLGEVIRVTAISPRGIETVEGMGREGLAVNFNIIHVKG